MLANLATTATRRFVPQTRRAPQSLHFTRLVITGATGSVGRQLIPNLKASGLRLLLVGDDVAQLSTLFPDIPVATFAELATQGQGYDALIHLPDTRAQTAANLNVADEALPSDLLEDAMKAGITRLVHMRHQPGVRGFPHVLARGQMSPEHQTSGSAFMKIQNVYIPDAYENTAFDNVKTLSPATHASPNFISDFTSAFSTTANINSVASHLVKFSKQSNADTYTNHFIFDNKCDNKTYVTTKRIIDLSFAIAVIALVGWLLLIIWGLIKIDSKGSGLFKQKRVGLHGKYFTCYKFRTMKVGTPQVGTHELGADSVTRLGQFLRKSKLDELPQVINILKGELSLVGPRPSMTNLSKVIEARLEKDVLNVLPGITGLAQVNDVDMSDPELLSQWDYAYVVNRSLFLDIKIIFQTFIGKGRGDRVKAA